MELKIYNPTEDGFVKAIEWNHEEIKAEVAEKMKEYASLVYTEDQIKEAKADRAKLNKFVQALEAKRKEIKKQCMQPYEDFEKKMKEITGIVNDSIKAIDDQVKGYEEQKKAEKQEQIKAFFQSMPKIEGFEDLKLSQIWNNRWLNASMPLKKVQDEISSICGEIKDSLQMLQNLPEFGFEAVTVYKDTLDVANAVNEAQRMSQIQKAKVEREAELARMAAEAEEIRKAEEEKKAAAVAPVEPEEIPGQASFTDAEQVKPAEPQKEWISFQALMTVDDALALKAFFESRNIEFKAV